MRVLAVDPGYGRFGVAVLEHERGAARERLIFSECVETDQSQSVPTRLAELGARFEGLLQEYEPDAVAIESLFFNKNQKTAIAVAESRGVALYLAAKHGCAVHEFTPQEIKVAVTGYGKSDKAAVMAMLARLVPEIPRGALDDEYDAIAVGLTALAHAR